MWYLPSVWPIRGAPSPTLPLRTRRQPPQAILASSVPTAATGQIAPAAQAREDPKDAVIAIKTIAELAIKSVEADVDTVKWIVTAIFSAMAGLVALLGFLGFRTFNESLTLVQKKAEEGSENLATLGSSISEMMTIQNFIEANHGRLTSLADEIRATQPSDQGYSEKSSKLESIAKQIIDDLNRMREYDKVLNRAALGRTRRKSDPLPGARHPAIERRGRVGEEP